MIPGEVLDRQALRPLPSGDREPGLVLRRPEQLPQTELFGPSDFLFALSASRLREFDDATDDSRNDIIISEPSSDVRRLVAVDAPLRRRKPVDRGRFR